MTKKKTQSRQSISHKISKLKYWEVAVPSKYGLRIEYKKMYYYE